MQIHSTILVLFFVSLATVVGGQPVYDMTNATVDDCEGVLQDSNEGPEQGQYDHNEDYTFTICVPEADEIILNFEFFATEQTYDILTIYEGPDKTGPVIATLDGVVSPAPSYVVNNECVTFHFVSDDNILANGWRMTWEAIIDEPKIPTMVVDGALDCPLDALRFSFDCPVDCDLLTADNFTLIGPGGGQIAAVSPINCDPVDMTTTQFNIDFADSLRAPGIYRLSFNGRVQDVCGEWHDIGSTIVFELDGCPIVVVIEDEEKACAGMCGKLRARVFGGAQGASYNYQWSHTGVNAEVVDICVEDSTRVTVTVTDQSTNVSTTSIHDYIPHPNPELVNPLGIDTFCTNQRNHRYAATIPGGEFCSDLIPSWRKTSGWYEFWRWNNRTDLTRDIIEYTEPNNGCKVRDTVYLLPIQAGTQEAACVGSAPFQVNGGTPAGGNWEGTHITPGGMFNPTDTGTFTVYFNAPNGCRASKLVHVTDSIVMPDLDTVCGGGRIRVRAVPFGGRWSGPQVSNNYQAYIEAHRLAPNQSYKYYYQLMGCLDSMEIYIEEISAGGNRNMCSKAQILTLPSRGNWDGEGVYDSIQNTFDISGLDAGRYTYILEKNGCTDRFDLRLHDVFATVNRSLEFCQEDVWYDIMEYIELSYEDNATLTADFLKDTLGSFYFNPSLMMPGQQLVEYGALGCLDSIYIDIEGPATFVDAQFCEFDDARELEADPPGGTWSGPGVIDPTTGLFDPQLVGQGFHTISYTSPRGCPSQDTVEVFEFMEAEITGVEQLHCFKDTVIQIQLTPPSGTLLIDGQPSPPSFNPVDLGSGTHEILYESGTGNCASSDRIFITILFPIAGEISVVDDSLCLGESTVIEVNTEGGRGTLTPTWDQGLDFGNSHIVSPTATTMYKVIVTDGCSVPYEDSVEVYIWPEFDVEVEEGPEVCFDEETFLEVNPPGDGSYRLHWQHDSTFNGTRLTGNPGFYRVEVVQEASGCSNEYVVELPGAAPLKANFTTIPNGGCIDVVDNEIEIIDLATGYSEGIMIFGDDSTDVVDLLTGQLSKIYEESGDYEIIQIVENELGCRDTFSLWICVENKVRVFAPNIFTPNGDDKNDVFKIHALGVDKLEWSVYNRWGELIFQTNDPDEGWDGTFQGSQVRPGVFVLMMRYENKENGFPYLITKSLTLVR